MFYKKNKKKQLTIKNVLAKMNTHGDWAVSQGNMNSWYALVAQQVEHSPFKG